MGATNSTLSLDTGIKMLRKNSSRSYRKLHSSRRHTKKKPFPNISFHNGLPNISFPNMDMPYKRHHPKGRSHRRRHQRSYCRSHRYIILPKGNWINTAKEYYVINNILYAKLKTKSGNYVNAQTLFAPNQRFQNRDGQFALLLYY